MTASLSHPIDGFIFDLDGTIYIGETLLPGAAACIEELRNRSKKVLFVSNKPLEPRRAYAAKLTRLGIPTHEDEVITSASVLAHHLKEQEPNLRYYVIGEPMFIQELTAQGLTVVPELMEQDPTGTIRPEGIDAVIVAFDRTLDYRKLNTAYQVLRQGARFFATNGDATCPMPGGDVPDAGATLAYLQRAANRTPELVAGKPSQVMLQVALAQLGAPASRCLIAGDRLDTDIRMGHNAGMTTALVLTGVTRREDVAYAAPGPDLLLENVGELLDVIRWTNQALAHGPIQQVERAQARQGLVEGQRIAEVAQACKRSQPTIYNWLHRFNAEGLAALTHAPRAGRRQLCCRMLNAGTNR